MPAPFLALVIDSILISIATAAIGIVLALLPLLLALGLNVNTPTHPANSGGSFIVGLIYYSFFLMRWNGQTPGKRLMKVRVVKTDGSPLRFADVFIRYIGYYLNSLVLLIGWIWAIFDDQKQGWHDKLARTYVVYAPDMG